MKPWRSSSNSCVVAEPFTRMPMKPHPDVREFVALCLSRKVEFLIVGGFSKLRVDWVGGVAAFEYLDV